MEYAREAFETLPVALQTAVEESPNRIPVGRVETAGITYTGKGIFASGPD